MFAKADDLAFNMSLEILAGCGFSCQDCAIDKTAIKLGQDVAPDLIRLAEIAMDLRYRGFRLHELTIGPTDIISSASGMQMLEDPALLRLISCYSSVTVSLALLLDQRLQDFGQLVNRVLRGKKFRLIVPCTLKNARNEKFLAMIKERIGVIKAELTQVEFKTVYLSVNVVNGSARDFSAENNRLVQEIDLGVPKLVEYVFPHGRKGLQDIRDIENFKRDLSSFVKGMHDCVDTDINRFLIPTISDSIEVTYRNGNLYYTPVIMEKFPIFDDAFVYPKPWSASAIVDNKLERYYESLMRFEDHPLCGNCCFYDNCARGDNLLIMDHLRFSQCLVDMHNRWDLCPIDDPVREG